MNWAGNLYLLAVAWPLARTDIREHRLPNKYTLPAIAIAFTAELIAAAISDQWFSFLVALIYGVAGFGFALLAIPVALQISKRHTIDQELRVKH